MQASELNCYVIVNPFAVAHLNYAGKFDATVPDDGSAAASHPYFHIDHPPAHAPADAIIVPDAHFLFNADFKRSGVDLILLGDDREVVFLDYFSGYKRAVLAYLVS